MATARNLTRQVFFFKKNGVKRKMHVCNIKKNPKNNRFASCEVTRDLLHQKKEELTRGSIGSKVSTR